MSISKVLYTYKLCQSHCCNVHISKERSFISNTPITKPYNKKKKAEEKEKERTKRDRLISRCFPAGIVVIIIICNTMRKKERNTQLYLLQFTMKEYLLYVCIYVFYSIVDVQKKIK